MQPAAWYWRLPVIRHIRYFVTMYRINRHYDLYFSIGYLPINAHQDYEIANQIWRGEL